MKTEIFNSYFEFLKRIDKEVNGVSLGFAEDNIKWLEQNETNESCWNCRGCSGCRGLLYKHGINGKIDISDPNPSDSPTFVGLKIPIITNIHQKILFAITDPSNKLSMSDWHHGNVCGTTHCRAGWVITLAGEVGRELEMASDTCFAAMMIYKYSSPNISVSPTRFFEDNETALKDIKKCAAKEKRFSKNKAV